MHKVASFKPEKNTRLSPSHSARDEPPLNHLFFSPKTSLSRCNARGSERSIAAEGYDKLKAKLMSYGLPETVVNELVEHHTPITYPKGSMIFLQGAPTDIIYWGPAGWSISFVQGRREARYRRACWARGRSLDSLNFPTLMASRGKPFKPVREPMFSWAL